MQIAVFQNENGNTASFTEAGTLHVYDYVGDHWEIIQTIPFDINDATCMVSMRSELRALAERITPCRNLVAAKLNGLAYTTFEVLGFQLWEIEGAPEAFLEGVRQQEIDRLDEEASIKDVPLPKPEATAVEGYYTLDLEKAKMLFTSKQVLYPFLKAGEFKSLEIFCSHVPPWFEREMTGFGYKYAEKRTEDRQYIVTIEPIA